VRASGAASFSRATESKIASTLSRVGGRMWVNSGRVNITRRPRPERQKRAASAIVSGVIRGRISRAMASSWAALTSSASPVR
jgi:hypothetical protein